MSETQAKVEETVVEEEQENLRSPIEKHCGRVEEDFRELNDDDDHLERDGNVVADGGVVEEKEEERGRERRRHATVVVVSCPVKIISKLD